MNAWLDGYLIPLLIGVPLIGMFFVAVMPGTDRIALRHAGLGAAIVAALIAVRAVWVAFASPPLSPPLELSMSWGGLVPGGIRLSLDVVRAPLLLGLVVLTPMTLRAGAPLIVERTKGYVLLHLLFLALATGALLSQHVLVTLALLDASLLPLLLLLGLFGGPSKGTAALRVGMSWLVVDAVAFAALTWLVARAPGGDSSALAEAALGLTADQRLLVYVPVALAAALRLAVAPACAWFVDFFREAPVAAVALAVVGVMPVGGYLLYDVGIALVPDAATRVLPAALVLGAATCVLGGCVAAIERDLRLVVAGAGMIYGGLAFVGISTLHPSAVTASLLLLAVGGVSLAFLLFCIDALERRYVTRDSAELFGVFEELPSLWRLTVLALVIVAGFPALGAGGLLLPLLVGMTASPVLGAAGLPANATFFTAGIMALGFVMLAVAVVIAVRRLSSPHFKQEARARASFSAWQALRLWLPALVVLAFGLLAPRLLPSLDAVTQARLRPALERVVPTSPSPTADVVDERSSP